MQLPYPGPTMSAFSKDSMASFTSLVSSAGIVWTVLAALLLTLPLLVSYRTQSRTKHAPKPFRFLDLPPELRNLVYAEVAADKSVQHPAVKRLVEKPSLLTRLFSKQPRPSHSNSITLVNHQLRREYSNILPEICQHTIIVDQHNYKNEPLWQIEPDILRKVRKCEVRLVMTSNMLQTANPNNMPRNWPVCGTVCNALRACNKLQDLTLHIRAVGDPLWNPLWHWYHASQNFKTAEFSKFSSITFSLDSPVCATNSLSRNESGSWEWRCPANHLIMPDLDRWQTIREFCGIIYDSCHECNPEQEEE